MTNVKATCPNCGPVHLELSAFELVVQSNSTHSYYEFECPECWQPVRKMADDSVIRTFVSAGLNPTIIEVPAEALEKHKGPAICNDDLLDFWLVIENEEYVASALEALSSDK